MPRLLVALPAEARPLVAHYRLQARRHAPFAVYEAQGMSLVVSGVGGFNAIAATAFLQGLTQDNGTGPWINYGICGHRDHEVGTPLMAHKVRDSASGQSFYPTFSFKPPCTTAEVASVQRPVTHYPDACAYDMEAAAFWPAARRFAGVELSHCLKIVSDNPRSSIAGLTQDKVEALCASGLDTLDALLQNLLLLNPAPPPPHPLLQPILSRWRFSASRRLQLEGLLADRALLAPEEKDLWPHLQTLPAAADVLAFLHADNRRLPPPF